MDALKEERPTAGPRPKQATMSTIMLIELVRGYIAVAFGIAAKAAAVPQSIRAITEEALADERLWSGLDLPLDRGACPTPYRHQRLLDREQLSELVRDLLFAIICAMQLWIRPEDVRQMALAAVAHEEFWDAIKFAVELDGTRWQGRDG